MGTYVKVVAACLVLHAYAVRADDALQARAYEAMREATRFLRSTSTYGGYAGIYTLDLAKRHGEGLRNPIPQSTIWIQPPGTPAVGEVFLRAYRITRDPEYLDGSIEVARCLAWAQLADGGWGYVADMTGFQPGRVQTPRKRGRCTFDDDTTQAALLFLMHLDQVIDEPWLSGSIQLGLEHMLRSQFPNGAWPQVYPLKGDYRDYYTFNDKVINTCMDLMVEAYKLYCQERFLRSVKLAGDFIIQSQLPHPQAGWAQQYSHDMQPAWARNFEPPAVCSLVTARNIKTLVDLYLYTRDDKYLEPIAPSVSWLRRSKIGHNLWARFYQLGTNRPIYGDTDHKLHYTLEEISEERRQNYAWQCAFQIEETIDWYNRVVELGPERVLAEQRSPPSEKSLRRLKSRVARITLEQDSQGRWVTGGRLFMRDFVKNMNLLCDYLEQPQEGSP